MQLMSHLEAADWLTPLDKNVCLYLSVFPNHCGVWCFHTLSRLPVKRPDRSSSQIILSTGNFCTRGTNVKVKGIDEPPAATWNTEKINKLSTNDPVLITISL